MDQRGKVELISLVYNDLRQAAGNLMRRERPDHTLTPTAVVNEAMIRMVGDAVFDRPADQGEVCVAAMRVMREVLIDHARRRSAKRRGGGYHRISLDAVADHFEAQGLDVVAVHEALEHLTTLNERQSQVVTLRYFGGLTVPEVARALGVSVITIERDWRLARAWLHQHLRDKAE